MMDRNDDMPTDADLDLLETYLDDALPPAEAAALRVRLSVDAGLSATLDELRSQRAGRAAVWAALEPDDRSVQQLVWRVRGAVAAERNRPAKLGWTWAAFHLDPWRLARFTSAAAACVVLGFVGGRLGRGVGPQQSIVTPTAIVSANPVDGPVDVPIADEYGQRIVSQRFQNADQARRFLEDLHQARDPSGGPAYEGTTHLASELRY
jgi:anti-sigma factor RsiW